MSFRHSPNKLLFIPNKEWTKRCRVYAPYKLPSIIDIAIIVLSLHSAELVFKVHIKIIAISQRPI